MDRRPCCIHSRTLTLTTHSRTFGKRGTSPLAITADASFRRNFWVLGKYCWWYRLQRVSRDVAATVAPLDLRITVFVEASAAYVQCPAPGRLLRLGTADTSFRRISGSSVSTAGGIGCSGSAGTPQLLWHHWIFGLRSSWKPLRRTCGVLHQVGCYGWAQLTLITGVTKTVTGVVVAGSESS
jgi:hypothetical protein